MDRIIRKGYSLQFATPPPSFAGILENRLSSPDQTTALASEPSDLLGKQAISVVPPVETRVFTLANFLVPKKSGEMRPILDLSLLNQFMVVRRFHMLTTASVLRSMVLGDWMSSVDLRDAYFHISIAMQRRKFLRFSFLGVRYQYNCLPTGSAARHQHESAVLLRRSPSPHSVPGASSPADGGFGDSSRGLYAFPPIPPIPWLLDRTLVDRGFSLSTVNTYAAAISSCHEGFADRSVFSHSLLKRFLRGVRRQQPRLRPLAPPWDLSLVLRALAASPFEPLDQVPLRLLSWKTALHLALTSMKRVSDLSALSVSPECLSIRGDLSLVVLQPNPAFMLWQCSCMETGFFGDRLE
ncbi:hypothetical protein Q8A73_004007 [Channa argus]|nr:hypothetical protein Q8A73_004007 [Channa argus]